MSAHAIPRDAAVYVAGHRGLVGSALARRLTSAGFTNILGATREQLDLRDQAAVNYWFKANRPEYVFLVAGTVGGILANSTRPAEFIYDNLMIHATITHASHVHGVKRLLYLGSSCIYPRDADQPIVEEALLTGPLEPTNEPYAIAKISGIRLCQSYRRQYGSDFISAMPTNLYGPGDNFDLNSSHVVPALIRKFHDAKLAGARSAVVWGTGRPRREFLHVDDLADACLFLMERYDSDEHINVGTGEDLPIGELAARVRDLVAPDVEITFDASKPDGTPTKTTRRQPAASSRLAAPLRARRGTPLDLRVVSRPMLNVCTIVAANYLPYARVLADSFFAHHPDGSFVLLLIDDEEKAVDPGNPRIDCRRLGDLGLDRAEIRRLAGIYDVTELATAVKPLLLRKLVDEGCASVTYLDPDIRIYDSLEEVSRLAVGHGIVLTPHTMQPFPRDDRQVDGFFVLSAGVYNLGFVAIAPSARPFLDWWWQVTRREALSDVSRNMFTDQRWVDFVPGFFDHTILKDPGYNVAYWNLHGRELTHDGDRYLVERRASALLPFQRLRHQDAGRTQHAPGRPSADSLERPTGARPAVPGLRDRPRARGSRRARAPGIRLEPGRVRSRHDHADAAALPDGRHGRRRDARRGTAGPLRRQEPRGVSPLAQPAIRRRPAPALALPVLHLSGSTRSADSVSSDRRKRRGEVRRVDLA